MELDLELKKLTIEDLKNLIDLQNEIIENLHADEQHFILHRTAKDFLNALENPNVHVFGMYDGNRLVSQSILSLPQDGQSRDLEEFATEYKNSEIAIYKAVLVAPEYRGHGVMKEMLKVRENIAKVNGRKIAITQIAADNPASWVNAIQHNMRITKVDEDPEDQAKVIYLQKGLQDEAKLVINEQDSFSLALGSDVHKNVPSLFNKMQNLISKGMVGVKWDKENNTIIWQRKEGASKDINKTKQKVEHSR